MDIRNKTIFKQLASQAAGLLLPAIIFLLVLFAPLPAKFLSSLLPLRLPHLILGLGLYHACFRFPGKAGWLAGASLTAAFFALLLSRNWSLGLSNANIIGGFIPYKDGFYYYNGAGVLLSGQPIPDTGLQGAFRPLFPGLLAALLSATGRNLMAGTAVITLWLSISLFSAAWTAGKEWGALPAAWLMVLMAAFIAPMVGFNLTELPGLAYACLAFTLLMASDLNKNPTDVVIGGMALIMANSIRAGAFFMLPFVVLWAGYRLNTGKGLSLRYVAVFSAVLFLGLITANWVFPRLLTAAGAMTNGSFAWMLYGQAVGGAGWQYHYQALGTSDPGVVLDAAVQKILTYPQGFLIGALKSYRDLFSIGQGGIYDLFSVGSQIGLTLFWLVCIVFTLAGLYFAIRYWKETGNLLMICMAIGIVLSIPFLPPVDGGNRFYAGAVPFIYGLAALGLSFLLRLKQPTSTESPAGHLPDTIGLRLTSLVLFAINLVAPLMLMCVRQPAEIADQPCPDGQVSYAVALRPGSALDILPEGNTNCGRAPRLCLRQFEKYGLEKNVDDFFVKILELARASDTGIRLVAVHDLRTLEYYFFVQPLDAAASTDTGVTLAGCALPIRTQFQTIRLAQIFSEVH